MQRRSSRTARLAMALSANVALVVGQLVAGIFSHSLGLLADAGHNLTDAAALALSLVAVRVALRPPSPARSFGYHRATILAAVANAALLAAVTVAVAVGAAMRLAHPRTVHGAVVVAVAGAALVVNGLMALVVHERRDLTMRSAALHFTGDAMASLAVVGAGAVLMADPALRWADPVGSLAVAAVIVVGAWGILRSSVEVLLESSPADVDIEQLAEVMTGVAGVTEIHDLHVWSLSSEVRALSAHVVLDGHPTLEEAQATGDEVKQAVAGPFGIAHCTLELECERCVDDPADPCLMEVTAPEAATS